MQAAAYLLHLRAPSRATPSPLILARVHFFLLPDFLNYREEGREEDSTGRGGVDQACRR